MWEYPHTVQIKEHKEPVPDGGGGYTEGGWVNYVEMQGFLDTPSSNELYQAEQMQHPFDRHFYYPYRTDIKNGMRLIHNQDTYELVQKPLDQGGQQEVMRVNVRLVNE